MHILQSSGCFYFSCPRHGGRDREEIKERRGPGINFYVMEYPLTPFTSTAGSGGAGGTGAGSPGEPWVSRLLTHPCPM